MTSVLDAIQTPGDLRKVTLAGLPAVAQAIRERIFQAVSANGGHLASNLGVVGRYVLKPRIFHHIRAIKPGAGGEIQLTDAIQSLLADEQVLAYKYHGTRFDCGSKLGYLKATVEFALRHPEVAADFEEYLRTRSPVLEG